MLNLIRMNLYSLVRSMSFWVMIFVTALIAVFCVVMTNSDLEYMSEQQSKIEQNAIQGMVIGFGQSIEEEDDDEIITGITVDTNEEWIDGNIEIGSFLVMMFSSGMLALVAAVFMAIYTNAEQKTGFIKNIAGQIPRRGLLSLAKLAGIAVDLLIIFAVFIIAAVICGKIIWGDKLVLGDWGDIIKVSAIQYLLHLAFCTIVQMLCTVARGAGIGMTIGIFYCSGMTDLVYMGINYVIGKLGAEDFDIGKYDLMNYMSSAAVGADSDTLIKCVIAGAVYLAVCTAVSIIIMQKRDIK